MASLLSLSHLHSNAQVAPWRRSRALPVALPARAVPARQHSTRRTAAASSAPDTAAGKEQETASQGMLEHFVDGEVCALVYALRAREMADESADSCVQVVEIRGGGSARPKNLALGEGVRWFDVDLPSALAAKCERVAKEGSTGAADWEPVPSHFYKADFIATLEAHGFKSSIPTVWVMGCVLRDADVRLAQVIARCISTAAKDAPCSALLGVVRPSPSVCEFLASHGWKHVEMLQPPGARDKQAAVTAWMGRCLEQVPA